MVGRISVGRNEVGKLFEEKSRNQTRRESIDLCFGETVASTL